MDSIINLDEALFQSIYSLAGNIEILDWIFIFLAEDSRVFMAGLFFFGLILIYRRNPTRPFYSIFLAIMIFLLPIITSSILREAIMRPRPFLVFDIEPIIEQSIRPSLPSNHSAASFAVAGVYLNFLRSHFKPVVILAFLVMFSRVYAGIHFPLDVLTGGVIGILPSLGLYLQERLQPDSNREKKKEEGKKDNNKGNKAMKSNYL